MDHLERIRRVPQKLVAGLVGAVLGGLLLASCGGGRDGAAPVEERTAPAATTPTPDGSLATTAPTDPPAPTAIAADPPEAASAPDDKQRPEPTATPLPALLGLDAEVLATGFDQPVLVTSAPGSDLLFVVEREGVIRVVEDGAIVDGPFLDLRDRMTSSSIEQGLLGLAFHPEYADNGRLFAYWTTETGDSRLAEFAATAPTLASADSMRVVLDVSQPGERHNAGMLTFGPDGFLYLSLGDGGAGGATAQDTSNLLGSIVRLDVDAGDPYAIPPGNPFDSEIWVYGLRNPWRFSIDATEELVYIGDVGQDRFEEINVVPLDGAGTNLGWIPMEGDECFQAGCDPDGLALPVLQYGRADGCSVTGGWVYRGSAIPELNGHYFYADWCDGFVRSFRHEAGEATAEADWTEDLAALGQITSFGPGPDGELYAVDWDGTLARIVPRR